MTNTLIESILDKDFVSANLHLNDKLDEIMEQKLYEMKRMVSAQMNEIFGGKLSKAEIQARKEAGYVKAADYFDAMEKIKSLQQKGEEGKSKVKVKKKTKIAESLKDLPPEERARVTAAAKGMGQRVGKEIGKLIPTDKKAEEKPTPRSAEAMGKSSEKLKAPDWSNLSDKTVKAFKQKRREQKIADLKSQGKTAAASKFERRIRAVKMKSAAKKVGRGVLSGILGAAMSAG